MKIKILIKQLEYEKLKERCFAIKFKFFNFDTNKKKSNIFNIKYNPFHNMNKSMLFLLSMNI